ncbi:DUF748 domain-containing protein [Vibrio tritonius]|uniref:DUF748 domain-containing protein n=1 Tax=Vibrio tritonius TaxID=1435069 RepID=UPI00315CA216
MMTILTKWRQRFKTLPQYQRFLSYLAAAYGFYLIVLGGILPMVLERQLPQKATQLLGREVSIGEIHINPFLLRVTVKQGAIANWPQQEETKLFSFEQFHAQFQFWQSLFTLTPTLSEVVLTKPQVDLIRANNVQQQPESNITSILTALNSQPKSAEEPAEAESATPRFRADRIAIVDGSFEFSDHIATTKLAYHDMSFELTNLDLQAFIGQDGKNDNVLNQFNFLAKSGDDQAVSVQGQFQLLPVVTQASFALDNVDLTQFWPYAKSMIPSNLNQGMLSTNGIVRFRYENGQAQYSLSQGRVALQDVAFDDGQSANATTKLAWQNFDLSEISLSSKQHLVTLGNIEVNGLKVNGVLTKQGVDLQKLFTPEATNTSPAKAKTAPIVEEKKALTANVDNTTASPENGDVPWVVNVKQLQLSADVAMQDEAYANDVMWRITPISLNVSNVFSDFRRPIDYSWSLEIYNSSASVAKGDNPDNSGEFSGKGQVDIAKSTLTTLLAFKDFDLTALQPYLDQYANLTLQKGRFSTEGELRSAWKNNDTRYTGKLAVEQFRLNDLRSREPLVSWQGLDVDKLVYSQKANKVTVHQIDFTKPYAKVIIHKDRTTNIGDITKTDPNQPAPAQKSKKAKKSTKTEAKPSAPLPIALQVDRINVIDGSAYFSDLSLLPNFSSGIRSLAGAITDLSSQGNTAAKVDLKGKIDQYAPISLTGKVNPLLAKPYLDLAMKVKSAELTSVNTYSGTYAGYYIDKGQLSFSVQYLLDNGKLKGSNQVYIDQLQLGKPSNSDLATSLPVKLALALLQDRNGVIDLGVQVSGDVNDPSFGVGSVIWTAVKNILTKAVTSPFSLLANLVGSDEELNKVNFAAGQANIDASEQERLTTLAQALTKRPQLRLNVEGAVNPSVDANALAEQKVRAQLSLMGVDSAPTLTASYVASDDDARDAVDDLYDDYREQQPQTPSVDAQREAITQELTVEGKAPKEEEVETRLYASLYNQLIKAQNIAQEDLLDLAIARGQAVKAYLVNQLKIEPERVFLLSSKQLSHSATEALLTLGSD